jgi:hypothetical protein
MGYIKHGAAIFTSGQEPPTHLIVLREGIIEQLEVNDISSRIVTPIIEGAANVYHSFAVLPDGSKEGWDRSDEVDRIRREARVAAGQLGIDSIEVRFGGDDEFTEILTAKEEKQGRID